MSKSVSTNTFGVAKWVVSSDATQGTHLTIASALTSASSGDTIFIRDGTYTENLTLKAGVNLAGLGGDETTPTVTIVGKITATFAGTASISNLRLQTNSDFLLAITGSSATIINLINCVLSCTNNTGISYTSSSSSSQLNLYQCTGNLSTTGIALHAISSSGTFAMHFCRFTNTGGSSTASTISAGVGNYLNSYMSFPLSSSGTSSIGMNYFKMDTSAQNVTAFTCAGSVGTANNCGFASGTATTIVCTASTEVTNGVINSTNAAAISGAGTLKYGCLAFDNTSSTITTTTQTPCVKSNDAIKVVSASGASYTTKPQEELILVDGATTATVVPLASPTTGQKHIIKDSAGTAASNNITITPSGKNIDGAASYVINVNYGSVTIVYNGTQWNVV